MYTLHDQVGDKDLSKTRVFDLENGNKLYAKQLDPYGFWRLNLDKGQLPPWLADQQFTTWDQVQKAVARYGTERKVAISEMPRNKDIKNRLQEK